ncbi:hypothetical protein SNE40_019908 [Patella caerulea]|uniref:Uncharacterized protein n=1 Tax=Patella caerulea TaxID=87958 RepID=A0AAN8IZ40_PATCE
MSFESLLHVVDSSMDLPVLDDGPIMNQIVQLLTNMDLRMKRLEHVMFKIGNIETLLAGMKGQISEIDSDLKIMKEKDRDDSLMKISNLCDKVSKKTEENYARIEKLSTDVKSINDHSKSVVNQVSTIESEHDKLIQTVVDLQCRSMKNNLIFHGLKENTGENTEELLRLLIARELGVDYHFEFGNVHRFGRHTTGRNRPIVARFIYHKDLEYILSVSNRLRDKPYGINQQFPAIIEEKRKILYRVMKTYKQKGHKTRMVRDKLFIDGKLYEQSGHAEDNENTLPKTAPVYRPWKDLPADRRSKRRCLSSGSPSYSNDMDYTFTENNPIA